MAFICFSQCPVYMRNTDTLANLGESGPLGQCVVGELEGSWFNPTKYLVGLKDTTFLRDF